MSMIRAEDCAKTHVRSRIQGILYQLDEARDSLKTLMAIFDRDDVRQDDFYADAGLSSHLLQLGAIKRHLEEAIKDGGLLDEHFDREAQ